MVILLKSRALSLLLLVSVGICWHGTLDSASAGGIFSADARAATPTAKLSSASAGQQARKTPIAKLNLRRARDLINAYRRKNGMQPVQISRRLTRVAASHVDDLSKRNLLSHFGADGADPWFRVKRAGYKPRLTVENLGLGHSNLDELLKTWQQHPAQRKNLLLPGAEEFGLAVVETSGDGNGNQKFWALVLSARL